jgi:predicted  nucleic acid-binding Zn-ribbon protein
MPSLSPTAKLLGSAIVTIGILGGALAFVAKRQASTADAADLPARVSTLETKHDADHNQLTENTKSIQEIRQTNADRLARIEERQKSADQKLDRIELKLDRLPDHSR